MVAEIVLALLLTSALFYLWYNFKFRNIAVSISLSTILQLHPGDPFYWWMLLKYPDHINCIEYTKPHGS